MIDKNELVDRYSASMGNKERNFIAYAAKKRDLKE
jgi:hypothetical protein